MFKRNNGSDAAWNYAWSLLGLAIPFILAILLLHGLRDPIKAFHGSDEIAYHYPAILRFAQNFPWVPLQDYSSATTPLFHIVFAALVKIVGPNLPLLRCFNVLISYGCSVLALRFFRGELGNDSLTAFLAALVFTLSPYFFGISFLLLTDNLATLFTFGALIPSIHILAEGRRDWTNRDWESFALAAVCAALALLTRQLSAWLLILLAAVLVINPLRLATKAAGLAVLGLCVLPTALLFLLWGGPTPPSFRQHSQLNVAAVAFLASCVGLYALPFFLVELLRFREWNWRRLPPWAAASAALAFVLVWAWPLRYCAGAGCVFPTDGFIWRIAGRLPEVHGSSVIFYALAALGIGQIVWAWNKQGHRSPVIWIFTAYALIVVANGSTYQKYFDFVALFICLIANLEQAFRRPLPVRLVLAAFCFGFVAYAAGNPFVPAAP
jgi:hypothetical protein